MSFAKKIFGCTLASAMLAIPASTLANPFEPDPPPPSNFVCNGVTCEGWIVTGYDIDGNPIMSYVVLPDTNSQAPHPE